MNQKSASPKIRVVLIGGIHQPHLRPIPPIIDGAPEWNLFRLTEAAACDPDSGLEIHVISPCEASQWQALQNYPVFAKGKYHSIVFDQFQLNFYRNILRHLLPLNFLAYQLEKLPNFMSWWYLLRVIPMLSRLNPDFILINDRPHYVKFMRRAFAKNKIFLMVRYPLGRKGRRFLNLLDGILVNSQGMGTYIKKFIQPDAPPPVWQMPNTLGNDFFAPNLTTERFSRAEKVILFAGRLDEEKGVRELLLAFQKIYAVLNSVRLIICGAGGNPQFDGDVSAYEHSLHQLASQFPAGIIEFTGHIPNQQMQGYYHQASVAVFPSLTGTYVESFGMVALEAMRCGTPLIVSRQPGFEELVLPGETGLMIEDPRDSESLAQAILKILQDPHLAWRMAQAGYQRSLNYTPEKGLQSLQTILQNQRE